MIGAHPDRAAIRRHLEWLIASVRETHPDLRLEIAWGDPESEDIRRRRAAGLNMETRI